MSNGKITSGSKVTTIIGSMKFWDDMSSEAKRLHSEGYIVLLPFPDPDTITGKTLSNEKKEMYDRLIRQMIDS